VKKIYLISVFLISALLFNCGGNPEEDGDKSYAEGKYVQALSYYLQVKKSDPKNPKINEKIALSYMQKGLILYNKTHNVESFAGNFEKGENFIPDSETSPQFDDGYSEMLHQLAKAYRQAKHSNEIQKEQYFTKTLDLLDLSLAYSPDNKEAENTLAEIKAENFEQTYQKGMRFLKQAKKEKNADLYLTAEHYLERSVFFDPENQEAQKNLKLVRNKTLTVLDMDSDFPMAVADKQYSGGFLLIAFTALNNSGEQMEFDPQKISLLDVNDQVIPLDLTQTEKFDDGLAKKMTLPARKQIDGTLAFVIKKSVKIAAIHYELSVEKQVIKSFP